MSTILVREDLRKSLHDVRIPHYQYYIDEKNSTITTSLYDLSLQITIIIEKPQKLQENFNPDQAVIQLVTPQNLDQVYYFTIEKFLTKMICLENYKNQLIKVKILPFQASLMHTINLLSYSLQVAGYLVNYSLIAISFIQNESLLIIDPTQQEILENSQKVTTNIYKLTKNKVILEEKSGDFNKYHRKDDFVYFDQILENQQETELKNTSTTEIVQKQIQEVYNIFMQNFQ